MGARNPKNANTPGVRERILNAGLEVLRDRGVRHLTQVEVAARAGVRQSHLTYYFPARDDLLEAVTERAVEALAAGLQRTIGEGPQRRARRLDQLAHAITDIPHMRMFVALIVEADADPALRRLLRRGTERMEAALARALGVEDPERATLLLAALWGLGLYRFAMRPASGADPIGAYLAWLGKQTV